VDFKLGHYLNSICVAKKLCLSLYLLGSLVPRFPNQIQNRSSRWQTLRMYCPV
jgi:hypothetical protein